MDGNSDSFSGVAANIDRLAAEATFSQKPIQRAAHLKKRGGKNALLSVNQLFYKI